MKQINPIYRNTSQKFSLRQSQTATSVAKKDSAFFVPYTARIYK